MLPEEKQIIRMMAAQIVTGMLTQACSGWTNAQLKQLANVAVKMAMLIRTEVAKESD